MRKLGRIATRLVAAGAMSLLLLGAAQAAVIQIYFQAEIYDTNEIDGDARIGDIVEGWIVYESTTAEGTTGNYPGAVTFIDIGIVPASGPDAGTYLGQIFDTGNADIFVGTNSFELGYFVDLFSPNFDLGLQGGPAFGQDLVTATDEMVAANPDVLDIFTDVFNTEMSLQSDYTFNEAFATFNFLEVTVIPEPGSLLLLGLGLLTVVRHRRR